MKLYSSISVPLCTLKSDTRFCFALYHSHAMWDCQHILWVSLVFICFSCFFVSFCGFISLCPPNIYFINLGQRTKKHHSGVRSDVFLLYMISNKSLSVLCLELLYKYTCVVSAKSKRIAERICNILMNALAHGVVEIHLALCLAETYCRMDV